eukprot:scaffold389250_cov42-Prasinocladus_malaysianus.AAC.1
MPSLIACPPTLVGHWAAEIQRFLGASGVLRPFCYEVRISDLNQPASQSGTFSAVLSACHSVVIAVVTYIENSPFCAHLSFKAVYMGLCMPNE